MRRSMTPLTAWPAFADLMTILAIASLAFAAVATDPDEIETLQGELDRAHKAIAQLERNLQEATTRGRDTGLELDRVRRRLEELNKQNGRGGDGAMHCLWEADDDRSIPLLRVELAEESRFIVTRHPDVEDANVMDIPGVSGDMRRVMDLGTFEEFSARILRYGDQEDTFDGSCRFFVELTLGSSDCQDFPKAFAVANGFFLISNWRETNRIMRGQC